jgi:hypothetical protein
MVITLRQDPAFQTPGSDREAPNRQVSPRRDRESNQAYARRLHQEQPNLTIEELSQVSGAKPNHLSQDPAFRTPDAALEALRAQMPPRRTGEAKLAYARRLHQEHPKLTLEELSQLSGVKRSHLNQDPNFQEAGDDLELIHRQVSVRQDRESNLAYVRRLEQADPVNPQELSQLPGATASALRQDPAGQTSNSALKVLRRQVSPRQDKERNTAYARRLHQENPNLTLESLSHLSGAMVSDLRQDPTWQTPNAALEMLRRQVSPRQDNERNAAYALRLHQENPNLTLESLSHLSGAMAKNLRQEPLLQAPTAELEDLRSRVPSRRNNETNAAYARRLHQEIPELSAVELSQLSGVRMGKLRATLAVGRARDKVAAIRAQQPRIPREANTSYATRLAVHDSSLTLDQLVVLSMAPKRTLGTSALLRTLLTEPQRTSSAGATRSDGGMLSHAMSEAGLLEGGVSTHSMADWDEFFGLLPKPLEGVTEVGAQSTGSTSFVAKVSAETGVDWWEADLNDFVAGLPHYSVRLSGSSVQSGLSPVIEPRAATGLTASLQRPLDPVARAHAPLAAKRAGAPLEAPIAPKVARRPEQDLSIDLGSAISIKTAQLLRKHFNGLENAKDPAVATLKKAALQELSVASKHKNMQHVVALHGWDRCDGLLTVQVHASSRRLTVHGAIVVPGKEYALAAMLHWLQARTPGVELDVASDASAYAQAVLRPYGLLLAAQPPPAKKAATSLPAPDSMGASLRSLVHRQELSSPSPSIRDDAVLQSIAHEAIRARAHQLRHEPWNRDVQEACLKLLASHPAWPARQPLTYFADTDEGLGLERALARADLPVRIVRVMDNLCVIQGTKIKHSGSGERGFEGALGMALDRAGWRTLYTALAQGLADVSATTSFMQVLRQGLAAHIERDPKAAFAVLSAPMPEPAHRVQTPLYNEGVALFVYQTCNDIGAWAQEVRGETPGAAVQALCERLVTRLPGWKAHVRLHVLSEDADSYRAAYQGGHEVVFNPLLEYGVVSVTCDAARNYYGATDDTSMTSFTRALPPGMPNTLFNALALSLKPATQANAPMAGTIQVERATHQSIKELALSLRTQLATYIETHPAEVTEEIQAVRLQQEAALAEL